MKIMNSIIIKDNFFSNPNYYRSLALDKKDQFKSPQYSNENWKGYRIPYYEKSFDRILKFVKKQFSIKEKDILFETYFHYSLEKTKKSCFPTFNNYKMHIDPCSYSGIVYLTPDANIESGTTFIDSYNNSKIKIENYYNRLVCYPANILHGPTDLFGDDIYDGRLTLTFFINV